MFFLTLPGWSIQNVKERRKGCPSFSTIHAMRWATADRKNLAAAGHVRCSNATTPISVLHWNSSGIRRIMQSFGHSR
jgi:hypothetical protein